MSPFWPGTRSRAWPLLLTLLAFALRTWRLDQVPPGWSDDELSNVLVISQKVLQGDYSVYYVDATGLEAFYHVLAAGMLVLFGYNAIGIRLLSAILGTLAVPLTYRVGRSFYGPTAGLLAAGGLTASFWSLIYSRVNLRHVALPVFMLATVYLFWRALHRDGQRATKDFTLAGVSMGIGFYTYFASRGVPAILLAFVAYLFLFRRAHLRRKWQEIILTFAVALILALPLIASIASQEGADARVAEVARPIVEARAGNLAPLREHIVRTLSMFHAEGDEEFLYNIPHRPLFGLPGALVFWTGVSLALWWALAPLRGRRNRLERSTASAFLLLWWLAGITPGFLSVPPASLGHTILAQPATYLLAALPLWWLAQQGARRRRAALVLATLFLGSLAARDLPDYFVTWPQRGNVRFLYHADLGNVASYLRRHPEIRSFGITGLLAGPWDREAFEIELETEGVSGDVAPRWYDPRRAILLEVEGAPALVFGGYPVVENAYEGLYQPLPGEVAGGYRLMEIVAAVPAEGGACFRNGLCLLDAAYDSGAGRLDLAWEAAQPLNLPPIPLVSKPPPPGVYDGPRLRVFAHLLDQNGDLLVGDDGLWVDPLTLHSGDLFMQQHWLPLPMHGRAQEVNFGLYDPLTGERILLEDGRDHLALRLGGE